MSLNRSEQRLFDYVQRHPEERHHWQAKVLKLAANVPDPHEAARQLDGDLWRYYQERTAVVAEFRDAARHEGTQRVSLKNLAEYFLRLWAPPKPKKPKPADAT